MALYVLSRFEGTLYYYTVLVHSLNSEMYFSLDNATYHLQLWNQKWFGDFAPHAHFTEGDYVAVRSTTDVRVPKEDTPRKGSPWTTEEVMNDFGEFFATAVDIVGLLTKDDEY